MKKKSVLQKNKITILSILTLACIVICYVCQSILTNYPFSVYHQLEALSDVFVGKNNQLYIIENGKKNILVTDNTYQIQTSIAGNQRANGYFYASLICDDEDGNIYVADTLYKGEGTILEGERIFRYDNNGKKPVLLYEITYEDSSAAPLQYGNILSIRVIENHLLFCVKTENSLDIYKMDLSSQKVESNSYPISTSVNAAAINPATFTPVYCTRTGDIYQYNQTNDEFDCLLEGDGSVLPWRIYIDNNIIYYSDLNSNQIFSIDIDQFDINQFDTNRSVTSVLEADSIIYTANHKNNLTVTTDYAGIYVNDGTETIYLEELKLSNFPMRVVVWITLFTLVLIILYIIFCMMQLILKHLHDDVVQRVFTVCIVSLIVSSLVSFLILSSMLGKQKQTVTNELGMAADILITSIDKVQLAEITSLSDYKSQEYNSIKSTLDGITNSFYDSNFYFYYIIYNHVDDKIYGVMDYEDTMTTRHPFYDWEENEYTDVFKLDKSINIYNDISAYGSWSFTLKPLSYNADGSVASIIEVGTNMDQFQEEQNQLMQTILFTVVSSVIVIIMLMIEIIFFIHFVHEKKKRQKEVISLKNLAFHFPLRILIFITYFADAMQDVFIAILLSKIYEPFFNLPPSVGIALPMTLQLLMAALFAFFGGKLVNSLGIQKTLVTGYVFQLVGFTLCAATGNYLGILIGKFFVGSGSGLVTVTVNTIAALGDETDSGKSFSDINAGILSGVTVGAGIGSVILTISNTQMIFVASACFVAIGLLLSFLCPEFKIAAEKHVDVKQINLFKFITDKRIFSFLALALLPFLITLSYREYYFPLYAENYGFNEVSVGRLYLFFGLMIIYIGPLLSNRIIEKLGGKNSVILSSALMGGSILIFGVMPSMTTAIIGIAVLSIAISFGYTAQSTYYSTLPSVSLYGEGRAMGVYSLFDNGGQTLGPMVYGLAMLFGTAGILSIGIILTIFTILFFFINYSKKVKRNSYRGVHYEDRTNNNSGF